MRLPRSTDRCCCTLPLGSGSDAGGDWCKKALPAVAHFVPIAIQAFELVTKANFLRRHKTQRGVVNFRSRISGGKSQMFSASRNSSRMSSDQRLLARRAQVEQSNYLFCEQDRTSEAQNCWRNRVSHPVDREAGGWNEGNCGRTPSD